MSAQTPALGAPRSIRVMLVDDHQSMLWGLEQLIDGERPRMEVCGQATNAADALAVAARCRPDVVLLDLDLGKDSGLTIIRDLAAIDGTRVLIFTGVRDRDLHDRAVMAGACGIVSKEELAETILKAIMKAHDGELWLDRSAASRIVFALSRRGNQPPGGPQAEVMAKLTPRERQIVREIAKDPKSTTAVVARRLCISEHTLRNHLTSVYEKLEVANRLELWAFIDKHGLGEAEIA
ncbi:MAG: response regulator [Betaproteobacteria bacterium]